MSIYPMFDFAEYLVKVSTYKPAPLGHVELDILIIFAKNESMSVYQVFKKLKEKSRLGTEKAIAYNNVHKRVIRLLELQLIEELREHFERGAKHYKITLYGLISFIDQTKTAHTDFYMMNKDSVLIRSLLLQFFEEKTIKSLNLSPDFFKEETIESFYLSSDYILYSTIYEYMYKSCHDTAFYCSYIWRVIENAKLDSPPIPSLPQDEIIQQYISYLGGSLTSNEQHVLREIKKYKESMSPESRKRSDSSTTMLIEEVTEGDLRKRDWAQAPYPITSIYVYIFIILRKQLENNVKVLTFNILSHIGNIINSHQRSESDLRKQFEDTDLLISNILTDKKFNSLIKGIKNDFDMGVKQFIHFSKLERPKERAMKIDQSEAVVKTRKYKSAKEDAEDREFLHEMKLSMMPTNTTKKITKRSNVNELEMARNIAEIEATITELYENIRFLLRYHGIEIILERDRNKNNIILKRSVPYKDASVMRTPNEVKIMHESADQSIERMKEAFPLTTETIKKLEEIIYKINEFSLDKSVEVIEGITTTTTTTTKIDKKKPV